AVAGFLLVVTMAGTYYSVETIPAWHHPATWVFFFASAILTGSLAVGVALLVTWNASMKHATTATGETVTGEPGETGETITGETVPSATTGETASSGGSVATKPGLAVRLRLLPGGTLSGELSELVTRSLAGISLSAALAGVAMLVTYPIYFLYLSNGPAAAQEVADRLMMPATGVRLVLLAVVVVLCGVFVFVRARRASSPSRVVAVLIVCAFVLAVITELLGRGMHYEGLYHVGLNTTQYLLGQ
ncbi:hypothetical protein VR010_07110, partial [Actinomycetaceae bacterium L2_0104]